MISWGKKGYEKAENYDEWGTTGIMLIASAKIAECEGNTSPPCFSKQLPNNYSNVFCLVYQVGIATITA